MPLDAPAGRRLALRESHQQLQRRGIDARHGSASNDHAIGGRNRGNQHGLQRVRITQRAFGGKFDAGGGGGARAAP